MNTRLTKLCRFFLMTGYLCRPACILFRPTIDVVKSKRDEVNVTFFFRSLWKIPTTATKINEEDTLESMEAIFRIDTDLLNIELMKSPYLIILLTVMFQPLPI